MLKRIKIAHPDYDVFGVSDTHFGHNTGWETPLHKRRGYETVDEMDAGIVHLWNAHCTERSHVIHCGDFVFKDGDGAKCRSFFSRLNFGTMWLLGGNHLSGQKHVYAEALAKFYCDNGSSKPTGSVEEVYPLTHLVDGNPNKRVVFLPQYAEFTINRQIVIASHYPILVFNEQGHLAQHWCGHSHGSCSWTNKDTGRGRRIDLGIESFGRPMSMVEITRHLAGRDADLQDHHSDQTPPS